MGQESTLGQAIERSVFYLLAEIEPITGLWIH
jgi:hypothetical protein